MVKLEIMKRLNRAVAYADGGILCLATMHANGADQTVSRLLNFFPMDMREQVF